MPWSGDAMDGSTVPWLLWAMCSSLALHGIGYASLGPVPRPRPNARPPSEIRFEIAEARRAAPEPEPAQPEKRAEPQRARKLPQRQRPAPSEPTAPAEPSPPATLDLSGITLTHDHGLPGFSAPLGNGLERTQPSGPRASARSAGPATSAVATGPPLVLFAELSARPTPPPLEAALREHYPNEARRRGVAGSASVRARVDADGVVRQIQLLAETFAGFGEACRRTLRGSRWSPPRDHAGRAVATEVRYTCRFVIVP